MPSFSNALAANAVRLSCVMAEFLYLMLGLAGFFGLAIYVRFCSRL